MKIIKRFFLGLLPVLAGIATAATFNLFSPASGILKGNANTYITTAATSADVISLWSGTCNIGTFLRADGICSSAGSGSVTSVALTMPGVFSVTGSPVTNAGTLAVAASGTSGGVPYFNSATTMASSATLTASQLLLGGGAGAAPAALGSLGTTTTLLHGNAAGAPTFGAVSLTADVSGTLGVGNGGTGVTSSTGTGSNVLSASPALTGSPTIGGSAICLSTGTNCPASAQLLSYGMFSGNGVDCNPTAGFQIANIANCSRTGTGNYSVNFTASYTTNKVVCMVNSTSLSRLASSQTTSTSNVSVSVTNLTGTPTDGGVALSCTGT